MLNFLLFQDDELIYTTRNNLKSTVQNIKQNIKKELSGKTKKNYSKVLSIKKNDFIDLRETKSNRITLLLVVNEIERCVKTRSGKILKVIFFLNLKEKYYKKRFFFIYFRRKLRVLMILKQTYTN